MYHPNRPVRTPSVEFVGHNLLFNNAQAHNFAAPRVHQVNANLEALQMLEHIARELGDAALDLAAIYHAYKARQRAIEIYLLRVG